MLFIRSRIKKILSAYLPSDSVAGEVLISRTDALRHIQVEVQVLLFLLFIFYILPVGRQDVVAGDIVVGSSRAGAECSTVGRVHHLHVSTYYSSRDFGHARKESKGFPHVLSSRYAGGDDFHRRGKHGEGVLGKWRGSSEYVVIFPFHKSVLGQFRYLFHVSSSDRGDVVGEELSQTRWWLGSLPPRRRRRWWRRCCFSTFCSLPPPS